MNQAAHKTTVVRRTSEGQMDHPEYLIGGVIAALITMYLIAALLYPERF